MFCAHLAQQALDQLTATTAERHRARLQHLDDLQRSDLHDGQWSPEYRAAQERTTQAFTALQAFSGGALCTLDGPLGQLGLYRALQTQLGLWRRAPQSIHRLYHDVIPASQLATRLHQSLFPHSWAA